HVLPSNQLFIRDSINDALRPTPHNIQQYEPYNARNLAAIDRLSALTFGRMRALDVVAADQDIATGTQIGTLFGMNPFKGPLHHGFVSIDLYKGTRTRHTFTAVRADVESRVDLTKRQWDHLISSGRGAWYYKPS